jgi:NADPH:quinone reductase
MKAAVIGALGTAPRVTTHPDPSPATGGQVLIRVEATALNVVDLHVAAGDHRAGPPQLPYVPGLEAVGNSGRT